MNVESFFRDAGRQFDRAVQSFGNELDCASLSIAGEPVSVRIVGRNLAMRLLRPLRHLETSESQAVKPELTIDLWDHDGTGILPDPRFREIQTNPHPVSDDGRFTAHLHRNSTLALDRRERRLIGCFSEPERLSLYELGRPLHAPLAVWLTDLGTPLVHAGLIAETGRGVLLAGEGGVGKSTVAVTCLDHGFNFLSDDMIALESGRSTTFRGYSIFSSTYLEPAHLERFPKLARHAITAQDQSDDDKRLILLADVWPSRMERGVDIAVVVLPRIGSRKESSFGPASPAKALLALAPSSRSVNRALGRSGFEKIASLVEQTPCRWLELGSDLTNIPEVTKQLLDDAVRSTS